MRKLYLISQRQAYSKKKFKFSQLESNLCPSDLGSVVWTELTCEQALGKGGRGWRGGGWEEGGKLAPSPLPAPPLPRELARRLE